MKVILLLSFLSFSFCYINPVIPSSSADPGIFYYKNYFYVVSTTGNDKDALKIWQSPNLKDWELKGHVLPYETRPSWAVADVKKFIFIDFIILFFIVLGT